MGIIILYILIAVGIIAMPFILGGIVDSRKDTRTLQQKLDDDYNKALKDVDKWYHKL